MTIENPLLLDIQHISKVKSLAMHIQYNSLFFGISSRSQVRWSIEFQQLMRILTKKWNWNLEFLLNSNWLLITNLFCMLYRPWTFTRWKVSDMLFLYFDKYHFLGMKFFVFCKRVKKKKIKKRLLTKFF